jgi:hypothetical protein
MILVSVAADSDEDLIGSEIVEQPKITSGFMPSHDINR